MGTELGTGRAGGEATLADSCGRIVKSLRISVTDRCNLRCEYCLPRGLHAFEQVVNGRCGSGFNERGLLTIVEKVRGNNFGATLELRVNASDLFSESMQYWSHAFLR